MIITNQIRLSRILHLTWKIDLLLITSCVMVYLANKYVIFQYFEIPSIIATIIGTALAFFIGFNSNQAYDRWWEARRIMGAIVNDSRSWARNLLSYCTAASHEMEEMDGLRRRMIRRHIAFLYALKSSLRGHSFDYNNCLQEDEVLGVESHTNKHNAILVLQSKDLQQLSVKKFIDGFRFLNLDQLIIRFCDEMGKAERIKNTVFPPTYHYFTRVFIWLFAVVITMVTSDTTGVWSILIGWVVGFIFHTSHTLGMILLNPFEFYPTGIPLDQITRTIEINLLEMLEETSVPLPIQPIKGEYIM